MSTKKTDKHLRPLNKKQQKFVDEYLIDLNGAQAAIRAGYSEKTARTIAANLLAKMNIQRAVSEKREQLSVELGITQKRVLDEYAKIAFLDPAMFYDENGDMIPIHKLPKEISAAIAGMDHATAYKGSGSDKEKDEEYTKKIKICDKLKALDSLARHLGLFEKDNSQKQNDALATLLEKISNQGPPKPNSDDDTD